MDYKQNDTELNEDAIAFAGNTVAMDTEQPIEKKPINGWGIAALCVSILSWCVGFMYCVPCVLGLALSIVGTARQKKFSVNGLAYASLVLATSSLIFWGLVFILSPQTALMLLHKAP